MAAQKRTDGRSKVTDERAASAGERVVALQQRIDELREHFDERVTPPPPEGRTRRKDDVERLALLVFHALKADARKLRLFVEELDRLNAIKNGTGN